jgi:hypothetical protein
MTSFQSTVANHEYFDKDHRTGEAMTGGWLFRKSDETMRFRDPGIVALLAASILQTLKLPERHSSDMK